MMMIDIVYHTFYRSIMKKKEKENSIKYQKFDCLMGK